MIADLTALHEIRSTWNGVGVLRQQMQVGLFASVGIIGGVVRGDTSVPPVHTSTAPSSSTASRWP
jgi:hypothetical protein